MIHMTSTRPALADGSSSTWTVVCCCGWDAHGFTERQFARTEGDRHLDATNRTYCGNCGHAAGEHALLTAAATYGGLGQLCQHTGCLCTGYSRDTDSE